MYRCVAVIAVILIAFLGTAEAGGEAHWSYEGEDGPGHWGDHEEWSICRTGLNQSPIDLVADYNADLPELVFDYHGSSLRQVHNGHTIQQDVRPGNYVEIEGGRQVELQQLHFHSPSEHTVGGESFPMEVHLVHADEDGGLTVIGVLFRQGEENAVLRDLWASMPTHAGERASKPITIQESGLLPPTREYFRYNGSLTTPPCSEGVRWIVLKQPIEASEAQIGRYREVTGQRTNRPVQEHHARPVLE